MRFARLVLWITGIALFAGPALASVGTGYTLFGNAAFVMPGETSNQGVNLTSDCPTYPACFSDGSFTYSGIDIAVPPGLTFAGIANLSVNFDITGGNCGGGSPRFQINIAGKNLFIYIGPAPGFTGCPFDAWTATGNLIGSAGGRFDGSQLSALGGFYGMTYAQALAVLGSQTVTGIQLVVDGGWFTVPAQNIAVDNLVFNTTTLTFEPTSKEACKNGGWQNFIFTPGPFKNQGDCVSYFATGGKNQ